MTIGCGVSSIDSRGGPSRAWFSLIGARRRAAPVVMCVVAFAPATAAQMAPEVTSVSINDGASDLSRVADTVGSNQSGTTDEGNGARVASVSVVSVPDNGETYTLGEAVQVLVEFDSEVDFCSPTQVRARQLSLDIGTRRRLLEDFSGGCSLGSLTFSYDVRPNDLDADGVTVPANGFRLEPMPPGLADLGHQAVAASPEQKIDGSLAVAPEIVAVSTWVPRRAADETRFPTTSTAYGVGEEVGVVVRFDKPVHATGGRPEIALRVGQRLRKASLLPDRSAVGRWIFFYYVVQRGDAGADRIAIVEDSLSLNGGTISILGDARTNAILTHGAFERDFPVDGGLVQPPRVYYRFPLIKTGPLNGETYGLGERIWPFLWLDRRPVVRGRPELSLLIGSESRRASYFPEATYNNFVSFEYLVRGDDLDSDGLLTLPDPVILNGGSIVSAGSPDTRADLTMAPANHRFRVDGSLRSSLKISRISWYQGPVSNGVYGLGERIGATVCFNLPVEVTGQPELTLNIGGRTKRAYHTHSFASSGSESCLFFWYTVEPEDLDEDGISLPANALDPNGGTITLAVDDGMAADLSHEPVGDDGDHLVNGAMTPPPMVTSVSFAGPPARGGRYRAGDEVTVRVGFDKVLAVTGEPLLVLEVGSRRRQARYVRQDTVELIDVPYLYVRNFFSLSFAYRVQPGDLDTDGLSIPANALRLNGGSLVLAESSGVRANLSHSAVNPDTLQMVDAPVSAPSFTTVVAGQTWVLNEAVNLELPEATGGQGELTYSLSPDLPAGLAFDRDTRLLSGTPLELTELTAYEYTVTDSDLDGAQSSTLTFSTRVVQARDMEVAGQPEGDDAVELRWHGHWAKPDLGLLVIEARNPAMGWTALGSVDPSGGQFIVRGLEPETPYTFRLRADPARRGAGGHVAAQNAPAYSEEFSVTTGSYTGPCRDEAGYLCLRGGRFELRADWTDPDRPGHSGRGAPSPVDISDESGLFWFFDPSNIELVTKVLDGSHLNGAYWMFFGALSDVEYWLTLRDTAVGGLQRTYHNPPKNVCGQSDLTAFPGDLAGFLAQSRFPGASTTPIGAGLARPPATRLQAAAVDLAAEGAGSCEATDGRLCLLDNRFAVEVSFADPGITEPEADSEQSAQVLRSLTTDNTGFFWFFNQENIELAVKVLDGREINGRFWLLYGALSDVEYEITLTDTATGQSRTYRNEAGSICGEIDTAAF